MNDLDAIHRLGIALALGLMIGIERGWHTRHLEEGSRVAGLRTFGLIGLLGGVGGLLAQRPETVTFLPIAAGALVVFLALGYWLMGRRMGTYGITTEMAAVLTFGFGALSAAGLPLVAAVAAVATLILLGTKGVLHGFVAGLAQEEIYAAIKLLLISVVILPFLPREPVGPWDVLIPYEVWWFVVLLAGLSFVGYIAMRAVGPRHGLGITAFLGGVVSSTATTLSFARMARSAPAMSRIFAAGILLASSIMPLRQLVLVGIVNPALLSRLGPPLGAMAFAGLVGGVLLWRSGASPQTTQDLGLKNPLALGSALKFGALFVGVMLLTELLRTTFGTSGIYALSAASAIADVDAVTLSLARLSRDSLESSVAANGLLTAACVNTAVKAVFVAVIAGRATSRRVAIGSVAMIAAAVVPWAVLSR